MPAGPTRSRPTSAARFATYDADYPAGTDVVKKVARQGTADGGPDGAPKETVTIESVPVS